MKGQHVDVLQSSTLWSALGSVAEEILDANFGGKETVEIRLNVILIETADFQPPPPQDQTKWSKGRDDVYARSPRRLKSFAKSNLESKKKKKNKKC